MRIFVRNTVYILPFIILGLVALLAFFQHPAEDDFVCNYIVRKQGIQGAFNYYFFSKHGNGRYFSNFIFICICSSRFLLNHYYLLLLSFMVLSYTCYFIFLRYFCSILFEQTVNIFKLHWLTGVMLVVTLAIIPEVSTFYFWTTGSTYMLSFSLMLLFIIQLHRLCLSEQKKIWNRQLLLAFTTGALLSGYNEVSLYFSVVLTGLLLVYRFFLYRRIQVNLALLFCLHFCLFAFAFISPGNKAKSVGFSAKQSILFSGGSAVYQTGKLLYHIFSNPLFWICIVGIILTFPYLKNSFREKMGKKSMSLISEFSLLMLVVWLFHFGIRQWGGWVVPLRAENIIICITVLAIFTIVWNNSFLFLPFIGRKLDVSPAGKLLLMGSFIFLMIFNLFTADLFRSLVAAPVHLAIVNKRTEAIEMARLDNKHIVYFETYQKEIRNELQRMFSQKAADFISEEFVFPPPYIFLKYNRSVFEFDGAYAEYYGIDSIIIEGKVIRRYGLNDAALFR